MPDEIRGLLTFGAWAFDAMSGVHSRAAAMKSLLKLSIFIKSSLDFFRGLRDVIAFSSNFKRLPEQRASVSS